MKIKCRACSKLKDEESFYLDKNNKSGRCKMCKSCKREYARQRWHNMSKRKKKKTNENRNKKRRQKKEWFRTIVDGDFCIRCGYNIPQALDYHHIDPDKKLFGISGSFNHKRRSQIFEELLKCCCLCSNCHREFHAGVWAFTDSEVSMIKKAHRRYQTSYMIDKQQQK